MSKHLLPVPEKPYPDWSRFIRAVWMHGISVNNIDPRLVGEHVDRAAESIKGSMVQRNEAQRVRPSAFLACARQTYYAVQGEDAGLMPDNIGTTFSVGHLLHEISYAAVQSAMPKGFTVEVEKEVSLPDWWPEDYERFNQHGHVDMFVTANDATGYLPEDAPDRMLFDFKTMGGFSYKKHGKTSWGEEPDAFGYLAPFTVLVLCGFGFPLPEEVTMLGSGFLLYQGRVDGLAIVGVCFAATLIGDSVGAQPDLDEKGEKEKEEKPPDESQAAAGLSDLVQEIQGSRRTRRRK